MDGNVVISDLLTRTISVPSRSNLVICIKSWLELLQISSVNWDGSLMDALKKYSSSQRDKRMIVTSLSIVLIISHSSSVGEFDIAQECERLRPR